MLVLHTRTAFKCEQIWDFLWFHINSQCILIFTQIQAAFARAENLYSAELC